MKKIIQHGIQKKKNLKYQFLWTYNGDIFIRKNNSSERIKISCELDIDQLM